MHRIALVIALLPFACTHRSNAPAPSDFQEPAEPEFVRRAETLCASNRDTAALREFFSAEVRLGPELVPFETCALERYLESGELSSRCLALGRQVYRETEAQQAYRRVEARAIKIALLEHLEHCALQRSR